MTALEKELALNLCDAGHQNTLAPDDLGEFERRLLSLMADASERNDGTRVSRLYAGSYFCDRFFLSLNRTFHEALSQFAQKQGLALALVIPIFGQSTLTQGRRRIEKLLSGEWRCPFDEVVVNDPAMAVFVREIAPQAKLHYGRLMAKTHRDPRHAEMESQAQGYALDKQQAKALKKQFGYVAAEIDPTAPRVTTEALGDVLPLALHLPHCFMTTGHICQAASDGLPAQSKFRPDAPCRQQCLRAIQVYEHYQYGTERPVYLTRAGRTVYFENASCEIVGPQPKRVIWTPADFMCSNAEGQDPTWASQVTLDPSYADQIVQSWNAATAQAWDASMEGGATWA